MAFDKLFLEKYVGAHFLPSQVPYGESYSSAVVKKLARFLVRKTKFSRFYICHDICIGSSRCRGHHGTLTAWLCDVIDTDFI
jgi:hypothetical protein